MNPLRATSGVPPSVHSSVFNGPQPARGAVNSFFAVLLNLARNYGLFLLLDFLLKLDTAGCQ